MFNNPTFGSYSSGFGIFGQQKQAGTTHVTYKPVAGFDNVVRNDRIEKISHVLYNCITFMKEFENKSLEELRLEDYEASRKRSTAGQFTFQKKPQMEGWYKQTKPFGDSTSTGTSAFKASNTGFGAGSPSGLSGASNASTGGLFSASNSSTDGLFGASNASKDGLFGASKTPTGLSGSSSAGFPMSDFKQTGTKFADMADSMRQRFLSAKDSSPEENYRLKDLIADFQKQTNDRFDDIYGEQMETRLCLRKVTQMLSQMDKSLKKVLLEEKIEKKCDKCQESMKIIEKSDLSLLDLQKQLAEKSSQLDASEEKYKKLVEEFDDFKSKNLQQPTIKAKEKNSDQEHGDSSKAFKDLEVKYMKLIKEFDDFKSKNLKQPTIKEKVKNSDQSDGLRGPGDSSKASKDPEEKYMVFAKSFADFMKNLKQPTIKEKEKNSDQSDGLRGPGVTSNSDEVKIELNKLLEKFNSKFLQQQTTKDTNKEEEKYYESVFLKGPCDSSKGSENKDEKSINFDSFKLKFKGINNSDDKGIFQFPNPKIDKTISGELPIPQTKDFSFTIPTFEIGTSSAEDANSGTGERLRRVRRSIKNCQPLK